MTRKLGLVGLIGFLAYTGINIFLYLWSAFTTDVRVPAVRIWHGDPFARAILVAVLFLIGLVVLVYVALARQYGPGGMGRVRLRQDLWEWLVEESEETNESLERLAERAVATYRARMDGARER